MPVINFEVGKLSTEQKRQVVKEFTETAVKVTGLPAEAFYIFIKENAAENIGVGGILQSERHNLNEQDTKGEE
ncbi:4-oxalocrotonate tautomerase DmpI [Candidatus Enterococcus ferrettii]|uniref:4-oxalocrotonate tautomerase-like domain-containing protein n=1 Tax=Candidatus Enterococcus ferrettii TaxID=2815324 RepID=A0ABV0EPH8_9ENTE|nr:4-oxalocrotonate tautomerase DmpI [Enterococcus sp. 665A]MBO1343140.1 tautomerase family protein [Enterococcus sp. 665A]